MSILDQFTVEEIISFCETEIGLNPQTIYCQMSGAPIGQMSDDEFQLMLGQIECDSLDSIADDLYIRTISAMRPSAAWNYQRESTLNHMREHAPRRLASHLLGKLFWPRDKSYSTLKRSMKERLDSGRDLIRLYARLSEVESQGEVWDHFLHSLIELDYKFDLALIQNLQGFPTKSIEFSPLALEEYLDRFRAEIIRLQKRKDELERKAQLENSWLASGGNRSLNHSFVASWKRLKPLTPAAEKQELTNRRRADIKALLSQIMRNGVEDDSTPTPPPAPKPELPPVFPNGVVRLRINKGL